MERFKKIWEAVFAFAEEVAETIRERAFNRFLAYLVAACILSASFLHEEKYAIPGFPYTEYAAWLSAIALFLGLVWNILRFNRPANAAIPTAIKNGHAFSNDELDGELFEKLERGEKIAFLRDRIKDHENTAVVIVHGEPCSGKTSIIQAGFQYQWLKQKRTDPKPDKQDLREEVVYWAATPEGAPAFRAKVLDEIKIDLGSDLDYFPDDRRLVMIIDRFEELQKGKKEHEAIFGLVESTCRQRPPFHRQLIIAFREQYHDEWLKMGVNRAKVDKLEVNFFNVTSAKSVMERILNEAEIKIDLSILKDYVENAATNDGVPPIDIVIGSAVLESQLKAGRREYLGARRYFSWRRYDLSGSFIGVLARHIQNWMNNLNVKRDDQIPLVKALLATMVRDERTRDEKIKGEGASEEEIARSISPPSTHLQTYLSGLAEPRMRVLEKVASDGAVRYRLVRAQLIPALRHLTYSVPPELDDTPFRSSVRELYAWWSKYKEKKFLLRGTLLSRTLRCFPDGCKDAEFSQFLRRSKHNRIVPRMVIMIVAVVIGLGGWKGPQILDPYIQRSRLEHWGVPPELYDRLEQLEELRLDGPSMDELRWLRSSTLRELEIKDSALNSLDGIGNLKNLQVLTLDLTQSNVDSLRPLTELRALRKLTLYLGKSKISDLAELAPLANVEELTLFIRASQIRGLTPLAKLHSLRTLNIDLEESQSAVIADLADVPGLRKLVLSVSGAERQTEPSGAKPETAGTQMLQLLRLTQIQNLSVLLNSTRVKRLPDLGQLTGLLSLTLKLGDSPVSELPDLASLRNLESLVLGFDGAPLQQLPRLPKSQQFHNLTLNFGGSRPEHGLDWPELQNLQVLHLDPGASPQLLNMQGSSPVEHLEELELYLENMSASQVKGITSLRNLQRLSLHLTWSQLEALPDLAALKNLKALALHIYGTAPDDLPVLKQFHNIRCLKLFLEELQSSKLPDISSFKDLSSLSIDVRASKVEGLPGLEQFHELQNLMLNLGAAPIQDLNQLGRMPALVKLDELVLNLNGSGLRALPDLSQMKQLRIRLNLRNGAIRNLRVAAIGNVEEITIDRQIESLAQVPRSVHKLNIFWYDRGIEDAFAARQPSEFCYADH